MKNSALLALALLLPVYGQPNQKTYPIESIAVEGTALPATAVISLSKLQTGKPGSTKLFNDAATRLENSGLFEEVNYNFTFGRNHGYQLTLHVRDQHELAQVRIEIPGEDEPRLWQGIIAQSPWIRRLAPINDNAQKLYFGAIERYLRSAGRTDELETDILGISSGSPVMVFRRKDQPVVVDVRFTGNRVFPFVELRNMLIRSVNQMRYSEEAFRKQLDQHVRSAYEERGYVKVRFPEIKLDHVGGEMVEVVTTIDEGRPYDLHAVKIEGRDLPPTADLLKLGAFPVGQLANWKVVETGIHAIEQRFKRDGYLTASVQAQRLFDDSAGIVDLRLAIEKGRQYRYGAAQIVGVPDALEQRVRATWKPSATAYDPDYPKEFLQRVAKIPGMARYKGTYETEAANGKVTVTFTFSSVH